MSFPTYIRDRIWYEVSPRDCVSRREPLYGQIVLIWCPFLLWSHAKGRSCQAVVGWDGVLGASNLPNFPPLLCPRYILTACIQNAFDKLCLS